MAIVFLKSHVKGHVRKNGVFVKDYDNKVAKKVAPVEYDDDGFEVGGKLSVPQYGGKKFVFPGFGFSKPKPKPQGYHPKENDDGQRVGIHNLSSDGPAENWQSADKTATVTPGGYRPESLNGLAFEPWSDAPTDTHGWASVEGQMDDLVEPELDVPAGFKVSAGVVIQEDDGRIWIVHPTNTFGGYKGTFPKGTVEDELPMQANAIKEAYEESGLKVEITGFFGDVKRTTSMARYYTAKRIGGDPADCGWESQAVSLVPVANLYAELNSAVDHDAAEKLGAGPKPAKPAFSFGQGKLF